LHRLVDRIDALRAELNDVLRDPTADEQAERCSTVDAPITESNFPPAIPPLVAPSSSSTGWFASRSIEVQVASYQGAGARYVAHRDAVVGSPPHRRITCIVYLSEWTRREQGGCLRVYTIPPCMAATDSSTSVSFVLPYFRASDPHSSHPLPADSIFLPETPPAADAQPKYVEIAPIPGRMVIFASVLMLHEVLPAYELERFAMTVWMK
jgi:Rps23 Pro-64 3,4-dihydroxylase Tpa1-like proline 4-hydroxylase